MYQLESNEPPLSQVQSYFDANQADSGTCSSWTNLLVSDSEQILRQQCCLARADSDSANHETRRSNLPAAAEGS